MLLIIVFTLFFAPLLAVIIYWSFAKQKSLQQHLQLERALFNYDNFLLLNMAQHKSVFEAIKKERISSQLRQCVLPVGSMIEGSHVAECPSDGGISQEMDCMLILPDVIASERDDGVLKVVSIEGDNPGYANLKVLDATRIMLQDTPGVQELTNDPLTMFYEVHNDELFLSHKFVRVFERRIEYAVSVVMGTKFKDGLAVGIKRKKIADFYPVMTIFFREPISCLIWPDSAAWPDCAVGALFDMLSVIQDCQHDLAWQKQFIDIAPAILCEMPLDIKNEWLKRERHWPNQELVEKISTLHCYLLAKPHPLTKNKLLEWRYSFCSAELLLSSAIKPWQKQCLMVLKALQRKYLQDPKIVASKHLKTVLYRVLESLPDHKRESLSRGDLLKKLLDELISCVQHKNLPNFFIPESNLFRHCEDVHLCTVLAKLRDMRQNLLLHLTEDLFTTAVTEERDEKEFQEAYWGVI